MRRRGFSLGQQKQTETLCPPSVQELVLNPSAPLGPQDVSESNNQFGLLCVPDVPTGSVSRLMEAGERL